MVEERPVDELFVAWRDESKLTRPVGRLSRVKRHGRTTYVFEYLRAAKTAKGFRTVPGFPDLEKRYESTDLFPTFQNRLMPVERPDYEVWLSRLELETSPDIFQVLATSGGVRMTDRIELFPVPRKDGSLFWLRFLVRGIRHVPEGTDRARRLNQGAVLTIRREFDNPVNTQALLLEDPAGEPIGYVPDYLTTVVADLKEANGCWPEVLVRRVNADAPPPMMVLADMTAEWPAGFRPFSEPEFQPIAGLAKAI